MARQKPVAAVRPPPTKVAPQDRDAFLSGRPETSQDVPKRPKTPRAPQGSKVLVERRTGDPKRRFTIYLTEVAAARLEMRARVTRYTMSELINELVMQHLK